MLGLLIKLAIVVVVGLGIIKFAPSQFNNLSPGSAVSLPSEFDIRSVGENLKNVDLGGLGQKLSQSLDNFVTHEGNSPVVLGIAITDESLKTIGNTLRNLPPDQLQIIKNYICQPSTPSAK
jgi:hypothetical protein